MSLSADLSGKLALITGASSGIGEHFARTLARSGADVLLAARRVDRLEALRRELQALGRKAECLPLDVADSASVANVLERAAEAHGAPSILINNAGITDATPVLDQAMADFERVMAVNVNGAFAVAQATGRLMRDNGGGTIINVASVLGLRQGRNLVAYASSKAAIVQMTKSLALDLARYKIRVNALAPGYIRTDMTRVYLDSEAGAAFLRTVPQRRAGEVTDLDGPMLLLASDASAFMTGAVIPVDGGHLVSSL